MILLNKKNSEKFKARIPKGAYSLLSRFRASLITTLTYCARASNNLSDTQKLIFQPRMLPLPFVLKGINNIYTFVSGILFVRTR